MELTYKDIERELGLEGEQYEYHFEIYLSKDRKVAMSQVESFFLRMKGNLGDKAATDQVLRDYRQKSEEDVKKTIKLIKWSAVEKLTNKYLELIKDKYMVSIEELARFLDVEIQYIQRNIALNVNRLSYPPQPIKALMKTYLYALDNGTWKEYKDTFRKKVLLDLNTTIEFLFDRFQLDQEYKIIKVQFGEEHYNSLLKKYRTNRNISIVLNYIVEKYIHEFNEMTDDEKQHLRNVIENKFKPKEEVPDLRFYSVNSLKVLWDKVYSTEVYRGLKATEHIKYYIYMQKDQAKPPARYLLDPEVVELIRQNGRGEDGRDSTNDDKSEIFSVQMPLPKYKYLVQNNINIVNRFYELAKNLRIPKRIFLNTGE